MLQTSILNARFLLGLKKWKQDPIFFPNVPGVSMRMDTEINPGSTCIDGKLFGESETKYKKMHFTVKHSSLEPIEPGWCYVTKRFGKSGPWRPWRICSKMRVSEMFSKVQTFLGSTRRGVIICPIVVGNIALDHHCCWENPIRLPKAWSLLVLIEALTKGKGVDFSFLVHFYRYNIYIHIYTCVYTY